MEENSAVSVPHRPARTELRYARLGEFYVDLTANQLRGQGRDVRLTPKSMAVLRELMLRHNVVVRRDDLLGLVWPDAFPTDDVLTQAIKELRRALGDDPRAPVVIETIPRVGYRLRASVHVLGMPDAPRLPACEQAAANETDAAPRDAAQVPEPPSPDAGPFDIDAVPQDGERIGDAVPAAVASPRRASPRRLVVAGLPWLALSLTLLAGAAWLGLGHPRDAAPAPTPAGFNAPPAEVALTSGLGSEYFPAISPDGSMIAYVAADEGEVDSALVLKGRDPAARAVELVPVRPGHWLAHVAWSPDGTRILYADVSPGECAMRVVPVSGGATRTISSCDASALDGFDWGPDQTEVYSSMPHDAGGGARVLMAMSIETGQRRALVYQPRAAQDADVYPRVSPDGRWIAFRRGAGSAWTLWLVPREGGTARPLSKSRAALNGFAWAGDSASVIVSSDHEGSQALYRVPIDEGVAVPLGIENAHFPSVARRSGHLTYYRDLELSQMVMFELSAEGSGDQGRLVAPSSRSDRDVALSPSGRRVAFVSERSGRRQLWVHDVETDTSKNLTQDAGASPQLPQWSPDETALLYVMRGAETSRLMRVDIATGRSVALTPPDEQVRMGSYSADGQWIDFASDRDGTWQLWRMRADARDARRLSRDGGVDPRSFAGDPHVYFTRPTGAGLYRIDPETRTETLVSRQVSPRSSTSYWIGDDSLWLFRGSADSAQARLLVRPVAVGVAGDSSIREVARLQFPGGYPAPPLASFSSDRRRLVATLVTRDGTDVFYAALADPVVDERGVARSGAH